MTQALDIEAPARVLITFWHKLTDTAGERREVDWDRLFARLSVSGEFRGDSHPGWSPATFREDQRSKDRVESVVALCLDFDRGVTIDGARALMAEFGVGGLLHTTRKHTAAAHRFRIVIPFSRAVSSFEYAGVWDRVAPRFGPVDTAPRDPSRFWFLPGSGDPGAFYAERLSGGVLDVDTVLATPLLRRQEESRGRATGDVAERARRYIARMPPAMSGSGGHVSTFRVAVALVRGFELSDSEALSILESDYNPRCEPPWRRKDLEHKIEQARRNSQMPMGAILQRSEGWTPTNWDKDDPEAEPEREAEWHELLRYNDKGKVTKDPGNAALMLANHKQWVGCLQYDEFADRIRWARTAPFMKGFAVPQAGEDLADNHATYVQHWFAKMREITFSKISIQDAIDNAAHQNTVHPVQEYLEGLRWDGVSRVATWLHTYLGAKDESHVHAMGRWWLISAVARIMDPGCQADHLLVLEGAQGAGKSTAAKILGGDWFLASLPDITSKDAAQTLQGHWITEIGELDAFRGAAGTRVKNWVTTRIDSYRPAYGHYTLRRPRQCVFIGTTNEGHYLTDSTGARRFWPVVVGGLRREALVADRDQLWAEALKLYRAGEQWHPLEEYMPAISAAQEERYAGDEWESRIEEWARLHSRNGFTVGDVLGGPLALEPGRWGRAEQTRVGQCLNRLGYHSRRPLGENGRVRRYFR